MGVNETARIKATEVYQVIYGESLEKSKKSSELETNSFPYTTDRAGGPGGVQAPVLHRNHHTKRLKDLVRRIRFLESKTLFIT